MMNGQKLGAPKMFRDLSGSIEVLQVWILGGELRVMHFPYFSVPCECMSMF